MKHHETPEHDYTMVCLGSATMDVFVETEKNTATTQYRDGKVEQYITYHAGEKVLIKELHFEIGGGGTNTAVCARRLGLRVGYIGAIGGDENGKQVQALLAREDIPFLGSIIEKQTNYSVILESSLLKDRTILVYKGASEYLAEKHVQPFHTQWLYISSLAGESFATALAIAKRMNEHGTRIAFNPSNYQIEHDKANVEALLRLCDAAIMNREEASLLVGEGTDRELLTRIRALGPHLVVVTNGSKGVSVMDPHHALHADPTPNIPVKETTGAGDCFASTFIAAVALGKPTEEAVRWALCNVEEHVQHVGAKAGLLSAAVLDERVKRDTRTLHSI